MSIIDAIGNTPTVELKRIWDSDVTGVRMWAFLQGPPLLKQPLQVLSVDELTVNGRCMMPSYLMRYLVLVLLAIGVWLSCGINDSGKNPPPDKPVFDDTALVIPVIGADPEPVIVLPRPVDGAVIQNGIDSLAKTGSGGTIRFSDASGELAVILSTPLRIPKTQHPVVINGVSHVTLSGQKKTRIIECANYARLIVRNITLADGQTDSSGAAILHPWYGELACYNVTFSDNRCTVTGPEFGGGAVFAGGLTSALFYGCRFSGNRGSNGGAILNRGTNLVIDSSVFTDNVATGDGGGRDAGAAGNGGLGGAVYIDGMNYDTASPFHLSSSLFSANRSHCHGSAVFAYFYRNKPGTSAAYINNCGFYDNADSGKVTTSTGTLYQEGAPLRLTACTFAGNTTLKHAGALFLGADATTEIVNCTFYRNTTPGNGGAIFGGKQRITIWNCTFAENTASYGPAIFNDTPDAVSIWNTLFSGNIPITNIYAYRNCTATYTQGNHVLQWPAEKANGKADNTCISSAEFADPLLDTLNDNGGTVLTMALGTGSPARDWCDSCPDTDARGFGRGKPCAAGAYEP